MNRKSADHAPQAQLSPEEQPARIEAFLRLMDCGLGWLGRLLDVAPACLKQYFTTDMGACIAGRDRGIRLFGIAGCDRRHLNTACKRGRGWWAYRLGSVGIV